MQPGARGGGQVWSQVPAPSVAQGRAATLPKETGRPLAAASLLGASCQRAGLATEMKAVPHLSALQWMWCHSIGVIFHK